MRVESLLIRQFRNYDEQALTFSTGRNILLGKNGQGKTNLLEALYCLSNSRSHRTATDRDLLQLGKEFTTVQAVIASHHHQSLTTLEMQLRLDKAGRMKTLFKTNGSLVKSRTQVIGILPSVSFFNTDLALLRGSPSDRRRWLDAAVSQYDKRHFAIVSAFEKVRKQKSQLLKEGFGKITPEYLSVWNEQFAMASARLIASRCAYLKQIKGNTLARYQELCAEREMLNFMYLSFLPFENIEEMLSCASATDAENALCEAVRTKLEQAAQQEIRRGVCLVGPHRDDICFTLNEMKADSFASQGQQRTIVLALKMAELALLTDKIGEPPILLLDDVMAELDPDRQKYLIRCLSEEDYQVFLATTHLEAQLNPVVHQYTQEYNARVFQVASGAITSNEMLDMSLDVHLLDSMHSESSEGQKEVSHELFA